MDPFQSAKEIIKYIAQRMKQQGIDINIKDNYDCTPLHFAAMRGNEIVTAALIKEGASVAVSMRNIDRIITF